MVNEVTTAPEPPRTRHRRRVYLAAFVAIVLTVAGAMVWRWWTHPQAFASLGGTFSAGPYPLDEATISSTVIHPRVDGSPETITIDGLRANFARNTAAADVTFWICHMAPGETPIGAVRDPGEECSDFEPFKAPMSFRHGVVPDSDSLFVTVTPTRSGVASLESVSVDYRRSRDHFYQRGTQDLEFDWTVTVR